MSLKKIFLYLFLLTSLQEDRLQASFIGEALFISSIFTWIFFRPLQKKSLDTLSSKTREGSSSHDDCSSKLTKNTLTNSRDLESLNQFSEQTPRPAQLTRLITERLAHEEYLQQNIQQNIFYLRANIENINNILNSLNRTTDHVEGQIHLSTTSAYEQGLRNQTSQNHLFLARRLAAHAETFPLRVVLISHIQSNSVRQPRYNNASERSDFRRKPQPRS